MSSRLTAGAACRLLRSTTTSLLRHHFSTTTTIITTPLPKPHAFIPFFQPYKNSTDIRFFSTRPNRPIRTARPDIGAKARQLQSRRLWAYAITFSCIAGFIVIVLNQFQDQLVFYLTPTDALAKYTLDPSKSKFRLGGLVLEGSVMQVPSSPEIEFVVTDLQTDILVKYEGSLPDLFREGHSVVVEGFIKPFDEEMKKNYEVNSEKENNNNTSSRSAMVSEKARIGDCYFRATEVLAKHDEKYMPQEVAAKIEENKKMLSMQQKEKEMEEMVVNGGAGTGAAAGSAVA